MKNNMTLLGFQGLREMINIHPLFAHFPIALLLASAVFYFLGAVAKKDNLYETGRWTLWLGTLSAGLAVWTGLKAENTVQHNEEVHQIMMFHQNLGYVVLALGVILSGWLLMAKKTVPQKGKVVFFGGLVLLSIFLLQQAELGGRMVYAYGTGVGRKSMVPRHDHDPRVHDAHDEVVHDH